MVESLALCQVDEVADPTFGQVVLTLLCVGVLCCGGISFENVPFSDL